MTAAVMHRPAFSHARSRSSDPSLGSCGSASGLTRSHASGSISAIALGGGASAPSTSTSPIYAFSPLEDRRYTVENPAPRKARRLTKRSSSSEEGQPTAASPRPAVAVSPVAVSPAPSSPRRGTPRRRRSSEGSSSGRGLSTEWGDNTADEDVTDHDVIETSTFVWSRDPRGRRMVNQYVRIDEIGRGVHGKVWLCEETNPETGDALGYCAIKEVYREDKRLRKLRRQDAVPETRLEMDDKVRQEIAIMKRCNHPHVVRLKEVINDPASKKIFMVLEYMAGGQVAWRSPQSDPMMTVDESRRTFRDVVLGLEYLHYQGIIHRDIKPANLLWDKKDPATRIVKISDFGVSHVSDVLSQTGDLDALRRKTAGSPAFFAPELCYSQETPAQTPTHLTVNGDGTSSHKRSSTESGEAYFESGGRISPRPASSRRGSSQRTLTAISIPLPASARSAASQKSRPPVNKAIDIWALGVTLYCLLFGTTPFPASNEYELFELIPTTKVFLPEYMGADRRPLYSYLASNPEEEAEGREMVDLLGRLLEKDPLKRISLSEVKSHPWVLRNLREDAELWIKSTDPATTATDGQISVSKDEISQATRLRLADNALARPKGGKTAVFVRAATALGFKAPFRRFAKGTPTPLASATPSGTLTPQRTRSDSGSRPPPSNEGPIRGLFDRFRSGSRTPKGLMHRRPSHSTTDDDSGSVGVGSRDDTFPQPMSPLPISAPHHLPGRPSSASNASMPDNIAASRDWSHFRASEGSHGGGSSMAFGLDDDLEAAESMSEDEEEDDDDDEGSDLGGEPEAWANSVDGWVAESGRATAQLVYNSRRRASAVPYDDVTDLSPEDEGQPQPRLRRHTEDTIESGDEQEVEIKAPRDRQAPPSPLPPTSRRSP